MNIHLIEKSASYYRVPRTRDEWVTGEWTMSAETAEALQNGMIFLHTAQSAGCYLGGKILECTATSDSRYEIRFIFDRDVINVTTDGCNANWAMEMLLDRGLPKQVA